MGEIELELLAAGQAKLFQVWSRLETVAAGSIVLCILSNCDADYLQAAHALGIGHFISAGRLSRIEQT